MVPNTCILIDEKLIYCNFVAFLPQQVRKIGRVVRAIAIMSHPIPNTNESHSVQIILPQKQLGRKSDTWVSSISNNFHWLSVLIQFTSLGHDMHSGNVS